MPTRRGPAVIAVEEDDDRAAPYLEMSGSRDAGDLDLRPARIELAAAVRATFALVPPA